MSTVPPPPSDLSGRLEFARKSGGLSSRRLSALAGIAQAAAGMIERGVVPTPTTETVVKIANVLGVTLDWLIAGVGPEPEPEAIRAAVAAAEAAFEAQRAAAPAPAAVEGG
jgi:transcriptional regulator with XRE-family HTH domain